MYVCVPDAGMGPDASCWSMSVCSQGVISSSQALTSDWRAEEREDITPSARALIYTFVVKQGEVACLRERTL